MKLISKNAFLTSLMTLATAISAVPSNSQYISQFLPDTYKNCSGIKKIDFIFDSPQENVFFPPCIQETVETIYDPNSPRKPNL